MRIGRLQMVVEIRAENFLRLRKMPRIQKAANVLKRIRVWGGRKLLAKRWRYSADDQYADARQEPVTI
jgi:hypothetical protein